LDSTQDLYVHKTFVAGPLSAPLIHSPGLSHVVNSLLTYLVICVICCHVTHVHTVSIHLYDVNVCTSDRSLWRFSTDLTTSSSSSHSGRRSVCLSVCDVITNPRWRTIVIL